MKNPPAARPSSNVPPNGDSRVSGPSNASSSSAGSSGIGVGVGVGLKRSADAMQYVLLLPSPSYLSRADGLHLLSGLSSSSGSGSGSRPVQGMGLAYRNGNNGSSSSSSSSGGGGTRREPLSTLHVEGMDVDVIGGDPKRIRR